MSALPLVAVAAGGAIGSSLRWLLGLACNGLWPAMPAGTLLANWIGGYVIGVLAALFAANPAWSETVRLFLITGLLGGLTTFSTFSAERDAAAAPALEHGAAAYRPAPRWLAAAHGGGLRHGLRAAPLT